MADGRGAGDSALMSDADLRELERALAAAPGDGEARLRLAQGLARAGQRGEALDRLDLALAGPTWFGASKGLADDLWAEELSRFEPSKVAFPTAHPYRAGMALDATGEWLAWTDPTGALRVGSLVTGELVSEGHGWLLCTARARFFAHTRDGGFAVLECSASGVSSRELPFPEPAELLAASPDGARVAAHFARTNETECGIFDAATLAPHFVERGASLSGDVDWDEEILELRGRDYVELRRFSGERLERHPTPGRNLHLLGRGLAVEAGRYLSLRNLVRGWRTVVGSTGSSGLSLSADGRGVRVIEDGKPLRVDIDLATGALLAAPPGYLAGASVGAKPELHLWHPRTDALFERRRPGRGFEHHLRSVDGRELVHLPVGHEPIAWTPDGHGLVVAVWGEGRTGEARFELWRARP